MAVSRANAHRLNYIYNHYIGELGVYLDLSWPPYHRVNKTCYSDFYFLFQLMCMAA